MVNNNPVGSFSAVQFAMVLRESGSSCNNETATDNRRETRSFTIRGEVHSWATVLQDASSSLIIATVSDSGLAVTHRDTRTFFALSAQSQQSKTLWHSHSNRHHNVYSIEFVVAQFDHKEIKAEAFTLSAIHIPKYG